MSGKNPRADGGAEQPSQLRGLDDKTLLAALREMFGPNQEAPSWFVDLANDSYGLRVSDIELAELMADSEAEVSRLLRAEDGPHLMSFEASDLSIEIEIQPGTHTGRARLIGQLMPPGPARIRVRRRQEHDTLSVDADERGRFTCENLVDGPLSLVVERQEHPPTATAWITIG